MVESLFRLIKLQPDAEQMLERGLNSRAETFLTTDGWCFWLDGSEAALIKVSKDLLAADAGHHLILMLADCSSA